MRAIRILTAVATIASALCIFLGGRNPWAITFVGGNKSPEEIKRMERRNKLLVVGGFILMILSVVLGLLYN
jgi:formate hydrogenlyase subunit 3/multisubunit Na+/H+ antiporter MnhD subunit